MATLGKASITVDLGEKAEEFFESMRSIHERLDEQERQIQQLWRRIHSLNETLEARGRAPGMP